MPTYIEYDKVQMVATRVLASATRPTDAAHLAYIQLPDSADEIDLSLSIPEILAIVAQGVRQESPPTPPEPPPATSEPEAEAEPAAEADFLDA